MKWDDNRWPNFPKDEMRCTHSGLCEMDPGHMDLLQKLRGKHGPLYVSSGYRHETHPIESRKDTPGEHTLGKASDIACWSDEAFAIAKLAFELGFTRIGVSQNGENERFIHLGTATESDGFPPALYSY